jgi:hypothetical protein
LFYSHNLNWQFEDLIHELIYGEGDISDMDNKNATTFRKEADGELPSSCDLLVLKVVCYALRYVLCPQIYLSEN